MPDGEPHLGVQPIDEVAAVERRGEPVPQGRLEQLLLVALVDLILVGELEDRARADRDLVAVAELLALDPRAVAEGAVRGTEIEEHQLAAVALHRRVGARDAVVEHADVGLVAPAEHRSIALEAVHLAEARPRDHDQVGARPPGHPPRGFHRRGAVVGGLLQGSWPFPPMVTEDLMLGSFGTSLGRPPTQPMPTPDSKNETAESKNGAGGGSPRPSATERRRRARPRTKRPRPGLRRRPRHRRAGAGQRDPVAPRRGGPGARRTESQRPPPSGCSAGDRASGPPADGQATPATPAARSGSDGAMPRGAAGRGDAVLQLDLALAGRRGRLRPDPGARFHHHAQLRSDGPGGRTPARDPGRGRRGPGGVPDRRRPLRAVPAPPRGDRPGRRRSPTRPGTSPRAPRRPSPPTGSDEAFDLAHLALVADPRFADAHFVVANVERARSQLAPARDEYRKYLELAPLGTHAAAARAALAALPP